MRTVDELLEKAKRLPPRLAASSATSLTSR
jgi:hypothetical protein